MVAALILVLAAWCPTTTTTTGPDRPRCPCETTTTSTAPSTTTTEPPLIIEPPHLVPPTPPTTTTTAGPAIADAAKITRPPARKRELPVTGPSGATIVAAGILLLLGGLFVAAQPGTQPPP